MFRKLISNLSFSPALVGQLGFYARRLRKEEATRRIGLIFTALALIVQFFAVFQPPTSANASSNNDFIPGGVTSLQQVLSAYDGNRNNFQDILKSLGVTRSEIAATKFTRFTTRDNLYSWGHQPQFSAASGEGSYSYTTSKGSSAKVYYRPLHLWESTNHNQMITYTAYQGYSKKIGWFAIMRVCGNLATKNIPVKPSPPPKQTSKPLATCSALRAIISDRTLIEMTGQATVSGGATIKSFDFSLKDHSGKIVHTSTIATGATSVAANSFRISTPGSYTASLTVNTSVGARTSPACSQAFTVAPPAMCSLHKVLLATSPECQPCEGTPGLWIKDKMCRSELMTTKTATNLTQDGQDATSIVAQANDKISYKITVQNNGAKTTTAPLADRLQDTLEYATLVDAGNGTFDDKTMTIHWPDVSLKPGEQQSRAFVVQMLKNIPASPTGQSNSTSYDCVMTNTFGNTTSIDVKCPPVKMVERTVSELPHTGTGDNMLFAGIVLAIVVFFYARARQEKHEIRLIRRDFNTGAI